MSNMNEDDGGTVLRFPLIPRRYIASLVEQCPALGVIARKLDVVPGKARVDCECILGEVFVRLLHLPRVTVAEAEVILSHTCPARHVADEEIGRLAADPEKRPLLEMWSWIWEREDDPMRRLWARYCVALVARLYRMEARALNERHLAPAAG